MKKETGIFIKKSYHFLRKSQFEVTKFAQFKKKQ